jgi:hypothetical protein
MKKGDDPMRILSTKLVASALAVTLCAAGSVVPAQDNGRPAGEVLTNEKVISLTRAGLSPALIVSKIRASRANFDTSTDELIRLKRERVPDAVIDAMVQASGAGAAEASRSGAGEVGRADPDDPLSSHEAGIYLAEEREGKRRMVQLEPSVYTQAKSGGFWKSAMTYGIAKVKSKAVLANSNARLRVNRPRPVFYFYFEVKNSGLSNSGNTWTGSSTSPNEFVLVKMEEKSNSRELVVGQVNLFGAQSGTLDKYSRPFDYEKIAPGVYKVTPRVDLADGEYGFFYGGAAPLPTYGYFGAGGGPKVFDFGVSLVR